MSAWTDPRPCTGCRGQYSLSDYGHVGAQSVAERIDRGENMDAMQKPGSLLTTCPSCKGEAGVNAAEAAVGAVAFVHDARRDMRTADGTFFVLLGSLMAGISAIGFFLFKDATIMSSHAVDQMMFQGFFGIGLIFLVAGIRRRCTA